LRDNTINFKLQLAILKCNQIELIGDDETGPKNDIIFHPKGDITSLTNFSSVGYRAEKFSSLQKFSVL